MAHARPYEPSPSRTVASPGLVQALYDALHAPLDGRPIEHALLPVRPEDDVAGLLHGELGAVGELEVGVAEEDGELDPDVAHEEGAGCRLRDPHAHGLVEPLPHG